MNKNLPFILFLIIAITITPIAKAEEKTPCDKNPYPIIGECFKVRGRLSFYNGNPSFRIWIVGTHHILSIRDSWVEYSGDPSDPVMVMYNDTINNVLTENIRKLLPPEGYILMTEIYGNYEVCPLDKEKKGWALPICIKSASNLYAKHFETIIQ